MDDFFCFPKQTCRISLPDCVYLPSYSTQWNLFHILCLDFSWCHEIYDFEILKFGYITNKKTFWSEVSNILFGFKKQNSKNISDITLNGWLLQNLVVKLCAPSLKIIIFFSDWSYLPEILMVRPEISELNSVAIMKISGSSFCWQKNSCNSCIHLKYFFMELKW